MKTKSPIVPRSFLMFAVLLCLVSLSSCSRACRSGPSTTENTNRPPTPSDSPAPDSNPPVDHQTVENEEPEEKETTTLAAQIRSSVRQIVEAVFLRGSPRPLRSGRSYGLRTGDRIRTNESGEAEVNLANCMTIYVLGASGLTLSACPGSGSGGAICSGAGTSIFNNQCRSRIKRIETDTAEINLEGTFLRVAYWPEKKRTIIDVHVGPVLVKERPNPNSPNPEPAVRVVEGCWCSPSDQCFVANVPSDKPRPCTDLTPENKAYLDRTKDKTVEVTTTTGIPIAPPPIVGGGGTQPVNPQPGNPQPGNLSVEYTLGFGNQPIGREVIKELPIENISALPLRFNGIHLDDLSTNFRLAGDTCLANQVELGQTCAILVAFRPLTLGTHKAFLNVADNAKGSPRRIAILGNGVLSPAWNPTVSPSNLDFGDQKLGATSDAKTAEVVRGAAPVGIPTLEGLAKDDFKIISNSCSSNSPICGIEVVFAPTVAGERRATLVIPAATVPTANAPRKIVELRGFGSGSISTNPPTTSPLLPSLTIADEKVCFTGFKVVDPNAVKVRKTKTLTLMNKGPGPLFVEKVTPSNDDFVVDSDTCTGQRVTEKCEINVGFTPRDTRIRSGSLSIYSNDPKAPVKEIPLAGRGKPRNWFVRGVQWLFRINQHDQCK
jgi:hypothetical protein